MLEADCAQVLPRLPDGAFELIYIDPPFNTGATRRHRRLEVTRDAAGERVGFGGHRYRADTVGEMDYDDRFEDYVGFLAPKLERARELLAPEGTLYVHLDYREAHYVKVALDAIFGRDCFLNEIIWAYDYGGKPARRWPAKHDTILVYVRDRGRHLFDAEAVEREPYMAPGLVGPEKAARGKRPTDTWWHTIVADLGPRADRLSDPEARGRPAADRRGLLAPGRLVPGLLRRLGHARRRLRGARAPLRADRLQPAGDRGDPRATRDVGWRACCRPITCSPSCSRSTW